VKDFAMSELNEELKYDEKNIRRRVYDALNVLMALEIISKDKKSISWKGFPSCCESDEQDALLRSLARAEEQREEQEVQLENLILQYVSTPNLLKRNKADGSRLDETAGQPG
jgi:transcription factor Dp-1